MPKLEFPKRTVHLDFHTGPWVPDVGWDFDPDEFAAAFKRAHVDSVTVFAKCHHGQLYYQTEHPARHPSLPAGLDLTGQQIEALHKVGIRAPLYISVQCDEFAANTHPEWICLDAEGRQVHSGGPLNAAWQIVDMSSPYQDYLAEQIQEVLDRFAPVDGLFLDMCWDQPSLSKWALAGMKQQGFDPKIEADRLQYSRWVVHQYMARFKAMLDKAQPKSKPAGVWFNSRPKTNLDYEQRFLRHVEIEALPTGGWGYMYFPYVARFVRPLGLPTLSHTGRFFKSWGDNTSLKPEAALKYECCQILSQGMTLGVGDLLHPRGVPSPAVYDLIGKVYSYIEQCEPWVEGGKLASQIALVMPPELGDNPGPSGLGATRALVQLQHQFDVVSPTADLSGYELVIVPECTRVEAGFGDSLKTYLAQGGALLIVGPAALDEAGKPVLAELGIQAHGESPYSHTFLRAGKQVRAGLADYDYVMYDRGFRMTPAKGATSLVKVGEPYFERAWDHFSGHEYTPEDKLSKYSAVVQHGKAITVSVPLLEAYGRHAAPNYRTLLANLISLLLPKPLVKAEGPSALQTTVVKRGKRTLVHVLSYLPERRADGLDLVEEPFPLVDMPLSIKLDAAPKRVFLAPEEREVPFKWDGRIRYGKTDLPDRPCDGGGGVGANLTSSSGRPSAWRWWRC